jgi:hypothetical protein
MKCDLMGFPRLTVCPSFFMFTPYTPHGLKSSFTVIGKNLILNEQVNNNRKNQKKKNFLFGGSPSDKVVVK